MISLSQKQQQKQKQQQEQQQQKQQQPLGRAVLCRAQRGGYSSLQVGVYLSPSPQLLSLDLVQCGKDLN